MFSNGPADSLAARAFNTVKPWNSPARQAFTPTAIVVKRSGTSASFLGYPIERGPPRCGGVNYNRFIPAAVAAGIELNRKMLSELAISDPATFDKIVEPGPAAPGRAQAQSGLTPLSLPSRR